MCSPRSPFRASIHFGECPTSSFPRTCPAISSAGWMLSQSYSSRTSAAGSPATSCTTSSIKNSDMSPAPDESSRSPVTGTVEIAHLTATELIDRFRAGDLSPVDATEAAFERIDALNSRVNAFCLVDEDAALSNARASERRWARGEPQGLLDGVPVSIKDIFLTKCWPTLRGSRLVSADQDWSEDAPSVARLRAQGAVLIGKTTTPELGWKGVTDSPLYG